MKVELHYGKGIVSLQVPRGNIEQIITPWQDEAGGDNSALLHEALASRAAVDFRNQIAGKRLCVLAEDGTRDVPLGDICDCLFDRLKGASAVQFLIATGTHKAETAENEKIRQTIEQAAGNAGIADFEMHAHDCRQGAFVEAGRTAHGTPVSFNAHAKDADVFLVLSDVKTHYFAGYSNPVKNFVPGICVFETAEQNHSLALEDNSTFGTHPWRRDESRRNNPVAADQVEAMQMIVGDRPVYAFVTISTCRKVQWAGFGPVEQVAAEAFEKIDERNTHAVKPVSKLIVSPGGFPNDISLYIAQRALELTKNAVTDGGEILFLAACPDGVGEEGTMENFYRYSNQSRPNTNCTRTSLTNSPNSFGDSAKSGCIPRLGTILSRPLICTRPATRRRSWTAGSPKTPPCVSLLWTGRTKSPSMPKQRVAKSCKSFEISFDTARPIEDSIAAK
ncbi:MAG: lactate racemase domain-containing protein [Planctomycetota bacterium]|jgi:nickel-dependent lactate racemase